MFVFVGLGSNLGPSFQILIEATTWFLRHDLLLKQSAVYETAPMGGPPQPNYLNAALFLRTSQAPSEFLETLLSLETKFGRIREPEQRNFPRQLDVDILLVGENGEETINSPSLQVPHPRLHLRTFVLKPLLDLDTKLLHPILKVHLTKLYSDLLFTQPAPKRLADRLL